MMDNDDVYVYRQAGLPSSAARNRGFEIYDFHIICRNGLVSANRNTVAAAIPYFHSLHDRDQVTYHFLRDCDVKPVSTLIGFAYSGRVNIRSRNVMSLLVTSHALQLNQVMYACIRFITPRLSINNITEVRTFAHSVQNFSLISSTDAWIRHNFKVFSRCLEFLSLPSSYVKGIICMDDLTVEDETVVFEAVISWVKHSSSERQMFLHELLNEVRLIYIPFGYLMKITESEPLIRRSLPCKDLLDNVKCYHLSKNSQFLRTETLFDSLRTRPRSHTRRVFLVALNGDFSVHDFNPLKKEWFQVSNNAPDSGRVHSVLGIKGKIYIFLGERIQSYCIESKKWDVFDSSDHKQIEGAALVSYKEKVYCFGSAVKNSYKKVVCFDSEQNKWQALNDMKRQRRYASAASVGEFIYVTGGDSGIPFCTPSNSVERYTRSTDYLNKVAPMLTARCMHGCTSINRKVYVCGGLSTYSLVLNTVEVYDWITDQWTYISAMRNKMFKVTLVLQCSKLYAFGKQTSFSSEGETLSVVSQACNEVYDPDADMWESNMCDVPHMIRGAVSIF